MSEPQTAETLAAQASAIQHALTWNRGRPAHVHRRAHAALDSLVALAAARDSAERRAEQAEKALPVLARALHDAAPNYGSEACGCGTWATPARDCPVHWALWELERHGLDYTSLLVLARQSQEVMTADEVRDSFFGQCMCPEEGHDADCPLAVSVGGAGEGPGE